MKELTQEEKKHFKSIEDRDLWIKLCAEYQIEWEKGLRTPDGRPTLQALNPRSMEEAVRVAINQLKYDLEHPDEYNGGLRVSLEEYLTLTTDEITEKKQKHFKEFWAPKFGPLI